MHLFLDLDGTLVHSGGAIARPHLHEFLGFCFKSFDTVSIWTAASSQWWSHCYNQLMSQYKFTNVYTDKDCEFLVVDGSVITVKPLHIIWKRSKGIITSQNSIIIDDNPGVARYNPDNLLMIDEFCGDSSDECLLRMIDKLRGIIQKMSK
jgi:TFIIF-interacting CTD phosphatase-like protein